MVLDIGVQAASALAAAHAARIVHRDIKPENIVVRKDRIVKVLDFGLAKLAEEEQQLAVAEAPTKPLHHTAPGVVMGTAAYMSPEQARGKQVDERTDIWSLGVVLYEMVAGRLPFAGETTTDVLGLILHKEPPSLMQGGPHIPAELARIVTKALEKNKKSAEASINSVAVLPLVNASNDANAEYLSDGISESVINNLSQLPQLKVISRSSTFRYKGQDVNPQEVAKALGVGAIVTGRVVRRGDELQVSVELMNAQDTTQMWGEQYNRRSADLQAVQVEIARTISEKLRLRLTGAQEQQLTKQATKNPQAYQLYLTGMFYSRKGGIANNKKALDYYTQAVALDPQFALAYAGMTIANINLTSSGEDPAALIAKARASAQKAVELDDSLAERTTRWPASNSVSGTGPALSVDSSAPSS